MVVMMMVKMAVRMAYVVVFMIMMIMWMVIMPLCRVAMIIVFIMKIKYTKSLHLVPVVDALIIDKIKTNAIFKTNFAIEIYKKKKLARFVIYQRISIVQHRCGWICL